MRQVDKLLAQVVQPVLGLAARPDPRDGRQVVCAHRGNRVVWPASRLRAFEPDEAVGKRTLLLELLAHDRLNKAEVLADHKRAGAATFVGEQGQQRRSGIADVRTLRCVQTVGRKSDGDVGDEADLVRGSRELPVGMELQPLVVRDAVWVETPDVLRPAPPGRAVYLAYRVERREVAQRLALAAHE